MLIRVVLLEYVSVAMPTSKRATPSPLSPFQGKKDGSAVKPPGHSKAPFVYSYMQTRLMG